MILHPPADVVRSFVEAVNAQDWDSLTLLVAPTFLRHSKAAGEPGIRSRDELLGFLRLEYQTFPDAREEILDLIVQGDKVAVRMEFRGAQHGPLGAYPPTGRTLIAPYLAIYRVEDGRIAEAWAEWDNLSALRSLGHLP